MANILGWKDFLRPIRDGYRHLFPSPDTGPTPEERAKQREVDRLKGFAYFDTIEQLETWTEAEADPLQRANTPLLLRPQINNQNENAKANLLLCHDYAGNYHLYESVQAIGVDEEQYACEYLQFVDAFIYFSHKLVCVPPPTWTNTLHRNGVKILGTLLVEPQTKDSERLLQHAEWDGVQKMIFPIAKKLAAIAKHYGFDGWLVNIEKPFPKECWDPFILDCFLKGLRDEIGPSGKVIWYDALTDSNKVAYQNALTQHNLPFTKTCESILTNYCWKERDAWDSKELAECNDIPRSDVFFGVDVWAQNTTDLTHPRVTYPEKDGGGTYTGVAVSKLAEISLSVGIFAPAWSFEHFPGYGRSVERAMWDGYGIPKDVKCSCGCVDQRHPPNRGYPITRSARRFPAGSEKFFYTDFLRGFGWHSDKESAKLYAGKKLHSQLGSQSILPHTTRSSVTDDQLDSAMNVLSQRVDDLEGRSQLVVEVQSIMGQEDGYDRRYERWLPLFQLDMLADGSLKIKVRSRYLLQMSSATATFYLKFASGVKFLALEDVGNTKTIECLVLNDSAHEDSDRLQEIGVHLSAPPIHQEPARMLEIFNICITPHTAQALMGICRIADIRIEHRNVGQTDSWRLCWVYQGERAALELAEGVPYSDTTGPFSYFLIEVDGLFVGRAHALEYILHPSLVEMLIGEGVEVAITGITFDGRCLGHAAAKLHI